MVRLRLGCTRKRKGAFCSSANGACRYTNHCRSRLDVAYYDGTCTNCRPSANDDARGNRHADTKVGTLADSNPSCKAA